MIKQISFGWGAAPFSEQLPELSKEDAKHFDEDNKAITRLAVRGIITSGERDKAIDRATKKIMNTINQMKV